MRAQNQSLSGVPPLRVWLLTCLILLIIGLILGVIAVTVEDAWLFLS